ncbi:hypothetical protein MYP_4852 [Sporocytophaga myxococcoides]|uniref:Uncharacterized protein n=1 Tax=Sporocytophaga myxococcoides TaxID=153721 RepID=A0A098LMI4_9BACT|nr:hypothetical protein MYP_4852 [Sporocytophaga myxococcoides]
MAPDLASGDMVKKGVAVVIGFRSTSCPPKVNPEPWPKVIWLVSTTMLKLKNNLFIIAVNLNFKIKILNQLLVKNY